jgi:hypothetical protein
MKSTNIIRRLAVAASLKRKSIMRVSTVQINLWHKEAVIDAL